MDYPDITEDAYIKIADDILMGTSKETWLPIGSEVLDLVLPPVWVFMPTGVMISTASMQVSYADCPHIDVQSGRSLVESLRLCWQYNSLILLAFLSIGQCLPFND